jgi:hypothetical protein
MVQMKMGQKKVEMKAGAGILNEQPVPQVPNTRSGIDDDDLPGVREDGGANGLASILFHPGIGYGKSPPHSPEFQLQSGHLFLLFMLQLIHAVPAFGRRRRLKI